MNSNTITFEELSLSQQFFRENSIEKLTEVAYAINTEQPVFTRVIFSFEHAGIDVALMEDLMESILIVYYVHTHIRKKRIPEITLEDVMKNMSGYAQFLKHFSASGQQAPENLSEHKFLEDEFVLAYATQLLKGSNAHVQDIPKEVAFGYFALLKSIELAAAQVK